MRTLVHHSPITLSNGLHYLFYLSFIIHSLFIQLYCVKSVRNTELFLARIFPHSDWIRRDTKYVSVFSPNAGKYGPDITPYLNTFHAVVELAFYIRPIYLNNFFKNNYVFSSTGCLSTEIQINFIDSHIV